MQQNQDNIQAARANLVGAEAGLQLDSQQAGIIHRQFDGLANQEVLEQKQEELGHINVIAASTNVIKEVLKNAHTRLSNYVFDNPRAAPFLNPIVGNLQDILTTNVPTISDKNRQLGVWICDEFPQLPQPRNASTDENCTHRHKRPRIDPAYNGGAAQNAAHRGNGGAAGGARQNDAPRANGGAGSA